MIKFFRRIRQKLLNEGKTTQYLKYAIGEIALVMIGILLALQVSNWNNNRTAKKVELNQIKQLLEDAKSDSIFFRSRSNFLTSIDSMQSMALNMYNPNWQDSIMKLKKINAPLFGTRLAYQSNVIINNNDAIDIIKNDTIKKYLKKYYAKYEYVTAAIELSNRIGEQYSIPVFIKYSEEMKMTQLDSLMKGHLPLFQHKDIRPNIEMSQTMQLNALNQVNQFNDQINLFIQKLNEYLILNND